MIAHRIQAGLCPDPARVVSRLFLPGEELGSARSRASQVVGRVMSLAEDEVERLAAGLLRDFGGRHHNYQELLRRNASIVSAHTEEAGELTAARTLLLGATFTAEYATEAAALCNPSAVLGPDQGGLRAGQARVALSVRGIGEGHISSIGFCSAVVGPGARWSFEPRVYCMDSHGAFATELLRRGDRARPESLVDSVKTGGAAGLDAKLAALVHVARVVQRRALDLTRADVDRALDAGASDGDVQVSVLIAAAFSMYNRVVDGLRAKTPATADAFVERARQIADHGYGSVSVKAIPGRG